MAESGVLIVVSAPSGCGKSTIIHRLMQVREKLCFSHSATTRAPREGEQDGVDYFFVSRDTFQSMIRAGEFLEYAEYVGNYYGTPKFAVDERLEAGCDVYLDIEVQGAMQVKRQRPETLLIFLMPPSMQELERRLVGRGQDDMDTIHRRLHEAERECAMRDAFDYVVVNDDVERVVAEINELISAHKRRLTQSNA